MGEPENQITIHELTPERWDDFETLFGPRGACAGCWCMYWRLSNADFEAQSGAANRQHMRAIVESGEVPGLLAYLNGEPAGWVALSPRETYARLSRSRILKPVDDQAVWSVVCFFVARRFRRQGITVQLLKQAAVYARQQGARILEGYPVEPREQNAPPVFVYTGLASAFLQAGFHEVLRRSEKRPIMRYFIKE